MMLQLKEPKITTALDIEPVVGKMQTLYRENIQIVLHDLLPKQLFFSESIDPEMEKKRKEYLEESLPIVFWPNIDQAPCNLSISLLTKHRADAANFFYNMISRWLIQRKKVNIEMFFAADFKMPQISSHMFTVSQIMINLQTKQDLEEAKKNMQALETEIRLGVVSGYHANRILEFKGLGNDGKTALIQDKIGSLIHRRGQDFDRSIFLQMQKFLVTCREEFKEIRDHHHISRIISILHSIRAMLKQKVELFPNQRHFIVKFIKTRLHYQNKEKPVLGVLVGLNFLRKHEVFEKEHLIRALRNFVPNVQCVENSLFLDRNRENTVQNIYLEIEKENYEDFTLDEIKNLRRYLPEHLKGHVEYLMHPIFMPRNEEEIVRNIMSLSRQLRYVHDIPQVMISFDEQKDQGLLFTVVMLRILKNHTKPVKAIFEEQSELKFSLDRIRKLGTLRRKYIKEAAVFRIEIPPQNYFRDDHSVDLFQARQDVIEELNRLFGEVRDFNGGMFCKQNELYISLKNYLGDVKGTYSSLLEKFFYSLTPVEMRSTQSVEALKSWYLLLAQLVKKDHIYHQKFKDWQIKKERKHTYVVFSIEDPTVQQKVINSVNTMEILSYQLTSFNIEFHDRKYFGYMLCSEEKVEHDSFCQTLQQALDLRV